MISLGGTARPEIGDFIEELGNNGKLEEEQMGQ